MPEDEGENLRGKLLEIVAIVISYILGVGVRILPALKYGAYLTADDPLLHYRITDYLLKTGHLPTYDPLAWHPWSYNPTEVLPILHYYTGAAIYKLVSLFGFTDLYTVVVYIPAFFAPLVVIPLYLTARELWGKLAAAVSSISISLSWAYINRSLAGFYRHEQFAIPLLMTSLFFTVKAMRSEEEWKVLAYSGLSGVFLVYASGIWAGFRALYDGYPLIMFLLLLLNRLDWRKALALGLPSLYVLLASFGALSNLAFRKLYISMESTLVWAALLAAFIYLLLPKIGFMEEKRRVISVLAGIALLVVFFAFGIYEPLTGRLLRVLFPSAKLWKGNVVETVAEHGSGATIETLTTLLIPGLLGLLFLFFERWRNDDEFTIGILTLVSLYFSFSMIRLPPLTAPFIALVAGFFAYRLQLFSEPYMKRVRSLERARRKRGQKLPLSRKIKILKVPIILFLVFVILPVAFQGHIRRYAIPGTSSYVLSFEEALNYDLGFREGWRDALNWMKENTKPDDVMISWWDYGYWMQTGAGKITIADGLTINETQIRLIARAFIGPEERMLNLTSMFNASYVVVSVPDEVGQFSGGGKWIAMAWIAGEFEHSPYRPDENRKWFTQDLPKFFVYDQTTGRSVPTEYTMNTTLYKMALSSIGGTNLQYFDLVHVGKNKGYVEVAIFKVKG